MLKTAPCLWTIDSLAEHIRTGPQANIDGLWVAARPYGYYNFVSRLRLAWMVFTGSADALRWPNQNPKSY
jgi:hypothetical protein